MISDDVELIAIEGGDSQQWEEAIDWLCIEIDIFIVTTAHGGGGEDEAIAFAHGWARLAELPCKVDVLHLPVWQ
ncbi:hypothetical protein [Chitinolyticbacter albus]|uniref:hypothetical protein n=1 Tax=Chitinolyticbacter albus TaxID=2961951 RepID=UPI00210D7583|nr:hypothetical protein [Chitinolyticbacter albus]